MNIESRLNGIHKATEYIINECGGGYLLHYPLVHLGSVSFGENGEHALPILECEDDFFIPERIVLRSYRRSQVLNYGNLVYQTGEISSESNFNYKDHLNDESTKVKANLSIMKEIAESFKYPNFIHPVLFMVHDIPSEIFYIAKKYELTLKNIARGLGPKELRDRKAIHDAFVELHSGLEEEELVHVPRTKSDGRVDLGDFLVFKDITGKVKLRLNDNPLILQKSQTKTDNQDSYTTILLRDFSHALKHKR